MLSILTLTLSGLLGGQNATDRPMVKVQIESKKKENQFLYDSGAQVCLITKKCFSRIKKLKAHPEIDFKLVCSGVSGSKLKVMGCYMLNFQILGRSIEHPFFVVDKIPGQSGVIGIDLIKKHGLSLDPLTNTPFFVNTIPEATVTKDVFLPARSRQACKIRIPKSCVNKNSSQNLNILQINVATCKQVFCDEVLLDANEDGYTTVYLTNVSETNLKLKKGTIIGEVEPIQECDLNPWSVSSTTPFANAEEVAKFKAKQVVPLLDRKRKDQILEAASLNHLPSDLKDKYIELLFKHHSCISLDEFDLGSCNKGSHSIPTKSDSPPTYMKQFPLPYEHEKEIKRQVLEWLKIGIVRPCESEYNSSLFLVAKKSPPAKPGDLSPKPKAFRIVQDLRALNKNTLPSNVRLPEIHECLDRIAQKKPEVFTSLDLRSGYFQLPIQKESQEKTAFTVPSLGQFCFNVTSQGLTSAPASFSRTMQRIFSKQVANSDLEVYLDDVLAYSKTHQDMLKTLDEALQNLSDAGMKINIDKCEFGISKLTYLGFELSKDGYKPDPIKSEGITKVHEPSTLKGVRSFMGMANFYRKLIPKFSQLTKPLTKLTGKGVWSGGDLPALAKKSFKKCQNIFTNRPFLHFPDFNLQFHLFVDASLGDLDAEKEGGLAGCVVQYPNNDINAKCRPIGFCSRGLQKHEKNYSANLIETAGIVFCIEFFEKYLRAKFVVHTDHKPITTIREGKVHKRTLERFREILATYDFDLVYTPGDQMPSDFMSRHANNHSVKINSVSFDTFSCKNLSQMLNDDELKAANSNSDKIAVHEKVAANKEVSRPVNLIEQARNCWAQAQAAAILAIKSEESAQKSRSANAEPALLAQKKEVSICNTMHYSAATARPFLAEAKKEVNCATMHSKKGCADVANQIAVQADVHQKPVAQSTAGTSLQQNSQSVTILQNVGAAPRSKTLKEKITETAQQMQNLSKFSVYAVKSKVLSFDFFDTKTDKNPTLLRQQQGIDPFVQAIKYFVTAKILPTHRYRDIIKRWGPHCFENKGVMMIKYARSGFPTRDLVIAPGERISNIIAECHGSLLGGHDSVDKTVQRILESYWFPSIHTETAFFIDNCSVCQRIKKKQKSSNTFLKPLKQADNVFERIHLDLFGPMKTETGKSYVMTITDSFSKFSIFKVIQSKDANTVAQCFFDNWIAIFGSPLSIVTDRGTDFNTEVMQKVCNHLQIDKRVIATKHPESNSQAEILNKKLAKYLKAMETEGALEWPKLVASCQYAYNLSVHRALKNSPYSVLFGVDANTPLNSKGFVSEAIYGDKYQHALGNRLKLARKLAKSNNMDFREDYTKRFDKKVNPHDFQKGMLVYLHRPDQLKVNPKIQSPWFGPFVVLEMINESNALIQELSNKKTKFVNVNRLRKYDHTIPEWNNFKLTLDKDKKSKRAIAQAADKKIAADNEHATAPLQFFEFDTDNDVVITNPEVTPIPGILPDHLKVIKDEAIETLETVSTEGSTNDNTIEQDNVALDQDNPDPRPGPSKSGKPPSFIDTAKSLLSPRKPSTRQNRSRYNDPVGTLEENRIKLQKAEKAKSKLKKK